MKGILKGPLSRKLFLLSAAIIECLGSLLNVSTIILQREVQKCVPSLSDFYQLSSLSLVSVLICDDICGQD